MNFINIVKELAITKHRFIIKLGVFKLCGPLLMGYETTYDDGAALQGGTDV